MFTGSDSSFIDVMVGVLGNGIHPVTIGMFIVISLSTANYFRQVVPFAKNAKDEHIYEGIYSLFKMLTAIFIVTTTLATGYSMRITTLELGIYGNATLGNLFKFALCAVFAMAIHFAFWLMFANFFEATMWGTGENDESTSSNIEQTDSSSDAEQDESLENLLEQGEVAPVVEMTNEEKAKQADREALAELIAESIISKLEAKKEALDISKVPTLN